MNSRIDGSQETVPLHAPRFGFERWDDPSIAILEREVETMNGHLVRTLGAVLAMHKPSWPAPERYLKAFDGIGVAIQREGDGVNLLLGGLPPDCFQDTFRGQKLPPRGMNFLNMVLADAVRRDWDVKERMTRAGLLEGDGAQFRAFIQGGHTVPHGEYAFAKEFGFALGTWFTGNIEVTTGCGPGVMEGPFKGLLQAYGSCSAPVRRRVGLTELGILAKEAPNGALSDLVTFPNIEERMEAFIRSAQFGIALRGGAGTMEEILVFAGLMNHAGNAGEKYPFYLFEPSDGTQYFAQIKEFIGKTAGDSVSDLFTWHAGTPQECVQRIQIPCERIAQCTPGHWNDSLVVPEGFLSPFEAKRDDFEALVLSRDRAVPDFLCDLRRLFSGLVTVTVKKPELSREYREDRPRVRVQSAIRVEMEKLLQMMQKEKRIPSLPIRENGSLDLPFEFIEP